jgi:hypothetical protein
MEISYNYYGFVGDSFTIVKGVKRVSTYHFLKTF